MWNGHLNHNSRRSELQLRKEQSCMESRYVVWRGKSRLPEQRGIEKDSLFPPPVSFPVYSKLRIILKSLEQLCSSWQKQFVNWWRVRVRKTPLLTYEDTLENRPIRGTSICIPRLQVLKLRSLGGKTFHLGLRALRWWKNDKVGRLFWWMHGRILSSVVTDFCSTNIGLTV